ncbi:MAG: hypothetical protein PHI24_05240 [Desulfitobacteriaceae bacterium]|nr:hypothetical protein [Desulfitobacteriaceae bacterium]
MESSAGDQYSEFDKGYSTGKAAQFFSCLSMEIQDELLSIMREMVKRNNAAKLSDGATC